MTIVIVSVGNIVISYYKLYLILSDDHFKRNKNKVKLYDDTTKEIQYHFIITNYINNP